MSQAVITVSNISKRFRSYRSDLRRVLSWFGVPDRQAQDHPVLRDISFQVNQGESVGILGVNGAGKSTLLKILSQTLVPDTGTVSIHGRVAAILELGMGFHPDLSGRQNVFQVGSLLGHSRAALEAAMADIEDFAEIGDYFDKPVRHYSSGMQVRLAFSLATAYRPDLLIVDEALSVGDVYFQHKSYARIKAYQRQGTSLLLVSHDRGAVQQVCDRAILLADGQICCDGQPAEVVDYYNAMLAAHKPELIHQQTDSSGRTATLSGTAEVQLQSLQLLDDQGQAVESLSVGDQVTLRALAQVNQPVEKLVFGYMLRDNLGQNAFGTNTHHTGQIVENLVAGQQVEFKARFTVSLGEGNYSISTCLSDADSHLNKNYEWRDLALLFDVINVSQTVFNGMAWIPPEITVEVA